MRATIRRGSNFRFKEVDSVLQQTKEIGVYFAVISGGEPFSKQNIFDIFRKHPDMEFLVFTQAG